MNANSGDVVRNPPTGLGYSTFDAVVTPHYCKRCRNAKFRCAGCGKIICLCEKKNNHITGPYLYICKQ